MDVAVIVGDGLLMSGAVVAAFVGRRAIGGATDAANKAAAVGERNAVHLAAIRDESVNDRIEAAVNAYAAEHPSIVGSAVMFDAMRDLLDALIAVSLDDDYPTERQPSPRAARLTDALISRGYVDINKPKPHNEEGRR